MTLSFVLERNGRPRPEFNRHPTDAAHQGCSGVLCCLIQRIAKPGMAKCHDARDTGDECAQVECVARASASETP